jgi:hypothetical protein
MGHTAESTLPDDVIEHDGMLWKPRQGATATAEEFVAARSLFMDVHREGRWNPWVLEDRAAEREHAMHVMDQWRRAEPGHRMLTTRQLEARWARHDRRREQARAKRQEEREARKAHFDQERANARLALIEHQSRLEHEVSEIAGYRDGSRFPKMEPTRRQEEIAALEDSIERRRSEIERLAVIVGDPETVVDQNGWLPKERREYMLLYYRFDRDVWTFGSGPPLVDAVRLAYEAPAPPTSRASCVAARRWCAGDRSSQCDGPGIPGNGFRTAR